MRYANHTRKQKRVLGKAIRLTNSMLRLARIPSGEVVAPGIAYSFLVMVRREAEIVHSLSPRLLAEADPIVRAMTETAINLRWMREDKTGDRFMRFGSFDVVEQVRMAESGDMGTLDATLTEKLENLRAARGNVAHLFLRDGKWAKEWTPVKLFDRVEEIRKTTNSESWRSVYHAYRYFSKRTHGAPSVVMGYIEPDAKRRVRERSPSLRTIGITLMGGVGALLDVMSNADEILGSNCRSEIAELATANDAAYLEMGERDS